MCLAIPGKVVEIVEAKPPFTAGLVEFAGVKRRVNLACVPDAREGDYVLVHAGVAITCINETEAVRILDGLRELELGEDDIPPPIEDVIHRPR
jgi:hydrogenase expression/formation protein HypC